MEYGNLPNSIILISYFCCHRNILLSNKKIHKKLTKLSEYGNPEIKFKNSVSASGVHLQRHWSRRRRCRGCLQRRRRDRRP